MLELLGLVRIPDPSRIAEVLNRVILKAWRGSAPAQINIPRDFWTQVIDIELQLKDLETVDARIKKVEKQAQIGEKEAKLDRLA